MTQITSKKTKKDHASDKIHEKHVCLMFYTWFQFRQGGNNTKNTPNPKCEEKASHLQILIKNDLKMQ